MTNVRAALSRELEQQFAALRTHGDWPDPWPDREVSDEAAYSRVTEPDRWLLGPERGEAWARALVGVGLAARTDQSGAVLLTPVAEGALPLRLLPHVPPPGAVDRSAALEIRAGDTGVVALEPDCHCDACDSGSAGYLREIDDAVWHVLEGHFVYVDLGRGRRVVTHRDGWSSTGPPERRGWPVTPDQLIADARAGRSRYPVVSGAAWW